MRQCAELPQMARQKLEEVIRELNKLQVRNEFKVQRLQEDKQITERFLSKTVKDLEHSNQELTEMIQEKEKAYEQLAEINKELEQFAYLTSHDLQEPLRTILNFSNLLRDKKRDVLDKEAQTYIGFIELSTQRMSHLIHALLDYSRIGKTKSLEIIDCEKLLDEVLADLTGAITENKALIGRDTLPQVQGVSTELYSLFQNLLSNALKYGRPNTPTQIYIGCMPKGDYWLFSVKDNGIGFDPRFKDKIFVMFQRLRNAKKKPGSGVGLAQCKKIVEMHAGKIWVESLPQAGSTFYFTLPKLENT